MLDDLTPVITTLPERDIKIYPLADTHFGAPNFMSDAWDKFVEKLLSEEDSYLIIAGDIINNAIKSSVSNIYRETCSPSWQKEWATSQLRPLADAGRILCGVPGNHETRSARDVDDSPLYDVFARLGIEDKFRENGCFLLVSLGDTKKRVSHILRPVYSFCVTHGAGGSIYVGGSAARAERFGMSVEGVDIFISGHTHKPGAFPVGKLVFNSQARSVTQKQHYIVTASSWLSYGDYAFKKMLPPTAHIITEIHLGARYKDIKIIQ